MIFRSYTCFVGYSLRTPTFVGWEGIWVFESECLKQPANDRSLFFANLIDKVKRLSCTGQHRDIILLGTAYTTGICISSTFRHMNVLTMYPVTPFLDIYYLLVTQGYQ